MAKKDNDNDNLFCSFCGKNQKEVTKLIAGPAVYICDECIQLCSEIIEEETEKEAGELDNLMLPKEIKVKLDEYVIEQELAKKILSGRVGIDLIAGPSEILVIADSSADPRHVAADILSQAEHDPMASGLMLTTDEALAHAARSSLEEQLADLPRRHIAEESLAAFGGLIVVPDLDTAVSLANQIAPEHLELLVAEPVGLLGKIQNAGAVFLGHNSPEPVGDYFAGPNHVLPTAGTARFASGLSVDHFVKNTSVISYSSEALQRDAADIMRLAELEGLEAHARSVRVRLKK